MELLNELLINRLILLGLFLPFVSFLILAIFYRFFNRNATSFIGCGSILISFICFTTLLYIYNRDGIESISITLFKWIDLKGMQADFTYRLDHLSMLMTLIITGVGFLIHVYSIGYTDHEKDYVRYFAFMNLFIFAMLTLVLAGNLMLLFLGWEGVGLASYLLVGYWYTKETAAKAATKAFVVNRIADLGFVLALLLTFYLFQTTDIEEITTMATSQFEIGNPLITLLTLLLFIGAIGKSAQIPLHVWLPDAMAGPTPVSALIHAATMVTAGVYLLTRLHILYLMAPFTLQVVGIIGGATALFASLSATSQTDLKKVLAYSTVSQLGLMFLACGTGAFYSAMFHLTMHAFIKALLFLSAGNVVHMMHGATEMAQMGGLHKKFPVTHWLFFIGALALAGMPPFAAFFSKDLILEQEYLAGHHTLFYIALAASILTGFYLMRAYFLTFRGEFNEKNELAVHAKEAPVVMLVPVIILSFLAMTGGFLGATIGKMPILVSFLVEVGLTPEESELTRGFIASPEAFMAIFGAFLGLGIAAILYTGYKNTLPENVKFLKKAFYFDQLYDATIVRLLKGSSDVVVNQIEPKVFDGSISFVTKESVGLATWLQRIQNGQIRSYAAYMTLGVAFILIYYMF